MTTSWPIVALLVGGCSFTLTGPDAKRPRTKPPECSMGKGAVLTDGIFASIATMGALAFGSNNSAGAVVPIAIAGLFVGSAIHGNNVVNDCRAATADYELAMRDTRHVPPRDETADDEPVKPLIKPQPTVQPHVQEPAPAAPPAAQAPQPSTEPQPPASPQPPPQPPPMSAEAWSQFWKEVR